MANTSIEHCTLQGAPAVRLHAPDGAHCTALLYGGQVVSWCDAQGRELLYLSPKSRLDGSAAVRGGIPVVFPQFAAQGPLQRHGFVRTQQWQDERCSEPQSDAIDLVWQHRAQDHADWPHDCYLRLRVQLQERALHVVLEVENTGSRPMPFCAALHTYLATNDAARTQLHGLRADGLAQHFVEPIDHLQFDQTQPLQLVTPQHTMHITQQGFADTVVWNPGAAHGLGDLPSDGYRHFVCVEAAQLRPVALAAGARWQGSQTLRVRPNT